MNKRTLGVLMQLIGLILFLFTAKVLGPLGPLLGIGLLIAGAVVFRKAKKAKAATDGEKPKKSTTEKTVSATVIIICAVIIGLLLLIVVPSFIKGCQEGRQQAIQRQK